MNARDQANALDVRCPVCKATKGNRCVGIMGTHWRRLLRATRMSKLTVIK